MTINFTTISITPPADGSTEVAKLPALPEVTAKAAAFVSGNNQLLLPSQAAGSLRRGSVSLIQDGYSRKLSLPDIGGGAFVIQLKDQKAAALIPKNAATMVEAYANKLATAAGRISYDPKEIPAAMNLFENDYKCSWHHMKNECSDSKVLQIVNDLRGACLEEIFGQLKKEFPLDLKDIADFGSSKLTSDRDFAFTVGFHDQAKESEIVSRFNEIFEESWKTPSATVFDSNAYTMQYVLTSSNPDFESDRTALQQHGSLLMKLRNITPSDQSFSTTPPESWSKFRNDTLSKITDPKAQAAKAREFDSVESQNSALKLMLAKEVLGKSITSGKVSGMTNLDVLEAAQLIVSKDVNVLIDASNEIHKKMKLDTSRPLEKQRLELSKTHDALLDLAQKKDVAGFTALFNQQIDRLISTSRDPDLIAKLQKSRIGDDAPKMMEAYHDKAAIDSMQKSAKSERAELEGLIPHFKQLEGKLQALQSHLNKGLPIDSFARVEGQMNKISKEMHAMMDKVGVKNANEFPEKVQKHIETKDMLIAAQQINKLALQKQHRQCWNKCNQSSLVADRLLIGMQKENINGMCFAQEAHVSEGAFGFVVLNLQAEKGDVRTLSQYGQAFREISGFYIGHQEKSITSYGKMVEVSKYAERLMVAVDKINERANALGVAPPVIDPAINKLKTFFKEIAPHRGTGKLDADLKELVSKAAGKPLDNEAVATINDQMEALSGTLEAWLSTVDEDKKNAYYIT